jgi:NitT/TauT family transport system permease protein
MHHHWYPHLHKHRYVVIVGPLLVALVASLIVFGSDTNVGGSVSVRMLLGALASSVLRLLVAYLFSVLLALPLALLINHNPLTEKVLLPVFDVLQSVPVLAFFPVIILFFVKYHFLEGAAVFVIFISMLWSIVFSLVGGLRLVPADIKDAAKLYHIRGPRYIRQVLAPAVFPYFVTGSLLAFAGGWNILIVAEVLHTYLPHAGRSADLFGIGSVMVHASVDGNGNLFVAAILVLVLAIAAINLLVWQRLLRYAERFRFE